MFHRWLSAQKAYQRDVFELDWDEIGADPERLTSYVATMLNAAFLEVAEAQQEVPWKPWATVNKSAVWAANRDKAVGECVDVLFFIANALGAMGCTDGELEKRYAAKMRVNERRQEAGYDGVTSKCAHCGRALDEPGIGGYILYQGKQYCNLHCQREAHRAMVEAPA